MLLQRKGVYSTPPPGLEPGAKSYTLHGYGISYNPLTTTSLLLVKKSNE